MGCRHDVGSYVTVPRDGWVEMNKQGFVKMDEETGTGVDFGTWLAAAAGTRPVQLPLR
jgi:hypothetical protein